MLFCYFKEKKELTCKELSGCYQVIFLCVLEILKNQEELQVDFV